MLLHVFLLQIYVEVKKFGKAYNIHCVCAYGGGNMHEQQRACDEGPEVIVATPVSWEFAYAKAQYNAKFKQEFHFSF